ncbi:glycosyl hydrolases family 16 domain-containing protein [Sarocladium implicatum]|nr:glycosyl hydrolases family 16 domain-containing protein [Sarocladium implicatum]
MANNYYEPNQGYEPKHNLAPNATLTPVAADDYGRPTRPVQTSMPWWNPRYWSRRIWLLVVFIVVALIAIIIAVVVTQTRSSNSGSYPDYTNLTYSLVDTYGGENFFDNFDYFTGYDPTFGFVHYVPKPQADQLNLTYATADSAVLRVDTSVGPESEPNASTGRFSVRITSQKTYDSGLFIFDVRHSPFGCGTWPALWLTDPSHWPEHGEIDVMEAINQADDGNQMTLHTSEGCKMGVRRKQTGKALEKNCDALENDNAGCGVEGADDTFGQGFNRGDGGIMAMEWRSEGIRMWQFPRGSVPSDIADQKPNPGAWGEALADFPSTDCNIGNHFKNQSIVANINLCGELTESAYSSDNCPSNCTDFVANNPDEFKNAFWEFGSFEIYHADQS